MNKPGAQITEEITEIAQPKINDNFVADTEMKDLGNQEAPCKFRLIQ